VPHVGKKFRADPLSNEEWNYLYGLFLADGYSDVYQYKGRWWSYRIRFFLQGDQMEKAYKVERLLRKTGLNPHIERDAVKDVIVVRVYSISLHFFPNGEFLKGDPVYGEEFSNHHELLVPDKGMPFIAGLLDGDGRCQARIGKGRRIFLGSIG
jgi:hypothetical protein